jgi:hypothetical protein
MTAEPVVEERVLDATCEMERLGVGRCRGYTEQMLRHSIDEALGQVQYPWALSSLQSTHQTYGWICILDRATSAFVRPLNFEIVVGKGATAADAVRDAVRQIPSTNAAVESSPRVPPDSEF